MQHVQRYRFENIVQTVIYNMCERGVNYFSIQFGEQEIPYFLV